MYVNKAAPGLVRDDRATIVFTGFLIAYRELAVFCQSRPAETDRFC